jgi:S1-C subfamily serine protease
MDSRNSNRRSTGLPTSRPVSRRAAGIGWLAMIGTWAAVFVATWAFLKAPPGQTGAEFQSVQRSVADRGDLTADEKTNIDIFREASPSVVFVQSTDIAQDYFSRNVFERPAGSGTGFIYDRDGHIVTNMHVVAQGMIHRVTLADQSVWNAKLIGVAADKDVAVLKIDAPPTKLTPITIGTSDDLVVGQKVLAIGNPFGFDHTLTVGVVSALGREIPSLARGRSILDVIQTDAAINPGNSGGPLLDSRGRIVGMNTQIASPSGGSAGIGFAIPVDIINRIVPQIIKFGRVIQQPGLGIVAWPDYVMRRLGLRGVLLRTVKDGSTADRAGLRGTVLAKGGEVRQLGDIVLTIDGKPTRTNNELLDVLTSYQIGDVVTVRYQRDEEMHELQIELQLVE